MEWLKSVIDYGVIGLLLAASVVAVAVAIERRRFYRNLHLPAFVDKKF